jgi:hypothetical protein
VHPHYLLWTASPERHLTDRATMPIQMPDIDEADAPVPDSPMPEKERWIVAKYVTKVFVKPLDPSLEVWVEATAGSYEVALWSLATGGAEVLIRSSAAAAAVAATARLEKGAAATAESAGEEGAAGMPVDGAEQGFATLLHAAVAGGHVGMLELLLLNGVAVDTADSKGRSALHWAILHKQDSAALLLLRHGASAAQTDGAGRTALDLAMRRGSIEDEELFLALSAV